MKLRIHPLAAALALDQLGHLNERLDGRRYIAGRMRANLRNVECLSVPELADSLAPSWYALALQYHPDQCDVPIQRIAEALRAEGVDVDQPGSTRPLGDHPLYDAPNTMFPILPEGWPRYRPRQFPVADSLHRQTLKLPVPHDDTALADAYINAFDKVLTHRDKLTENPRHE